ncbi:kinase [Thraustotheca clavata]|uniref:Kinase n=1 Tax=Thraustotheca clavata TaxID=74557 RepID=A0A1W0AC58_9STRA|nr:kinase [Thraustotheca clavata]
MAVEHDSEDGDEGHENVFFQGKYQRFLLVNCIGYAITLVLALVLVLYLRRTRRSAYTGSTEAMQKVVLPSFEPLLWAVCAISGISTLYVFLTMITNIRLSNDPSMTLQMLYQGRQTLYYLIVVFMMQKSVTFKALLIALLVALLFSAFQIVLLLSIQRVSHSSADIAQGIYLGSITLFFAYIFIYPPPYRASKFTWRLYSGFILMYYATVFAYIALFDYGAPTAGTIVVFITSVWSALLPYFIWKLLLADTQYWRSFAKDALQSNEETSSHDIVTAQGLQVLVQVHQQEVIDFAHLQLQNKIGVGASSVVYSGFLRSRQPVAIKVYTPSTISKATISEFSKETALCALFNHPNIAFFFGMCVSPPSICLVFELCTSSLDLVLSETNTPGMDMLWPQLGYMLDAARAVSYLHSFSPPFVHRDIKPANFLLDANHVVKLTDFGESRNTATWVSSFGVKGTKASKTMTVRGTADYMAPEIIEGKRGKATYSESADIYSLAVTFWDILNPGREKYPKCNSNYFLIYDMVLDGQRPPIDPEMHPTLQNILENGWNSSPEYRPSANSIVQQLESLQHDNLAQVASRLMQLLRYVKNSTEGGKMDKLIVCGEALSNCLVDYGYASCVPQAVRFGNALMDTGYLHHIKHTKPFDNTSSTYYFDNKAIQSALAKQENVHENALCMCTKLAQGHFGMTKTTLFCTRPRMPSHHHTLTMHLLNDIGDEEAVVVSCP